MPSTRTVKDLIVVECSLANECPILSTLEVAMDIQRSRRWRRTPPRALMQRSIDSTPTSQFYQQADMHRVDLRPHNLQLAATDDHKCCDRPLYQHITRHMAVVGVPMARWEGHSIVRIRGMTALKERSRHVKSYGEKVINIASAIVWQQHSFLNSAGSSFRS